MSSAPVVPSTPVTPANTTVTPTKAAAVSDIVVQHHPIIKLVIAAALIWFLAGKIETAWSAHEQRVFDAKNAALSAQVQQDATLAASSAADAAKEAQLAAQYQALLHQTTAQIASLQAQLKKQQAADAAMTPDALAAHWGALINSASGVHPVTGDGYAVSQDAAVATTQALDSIPTLNAQIESDSEVLSAQTGLLSADDKQIGDLNAQVKGLQTTNTEEITTCTAQVAQVKADDAVALHKSRKKWFIAGVITGFVGGLFGGHSGL